VWQVKLCKEWPLLCHAGWTMDCPLLYHSIPHISWRISYTFSTFSIADQCQVLRKQMCNWSWDNRLKQPRNFFCDALCDYLSALTSQGERLHLLCVTECCAVRNITWMSPQTLNSVYWGEPEQAPPSPYNTCAVNIYNISAKVRNLALHYPTTHNYPGMHSCNDFDAAWRHSHGESQQEVLSMEVTHGRRTSWIEVSRANTGRCRHTFKSIEWTEAGHRRVWELYSSTCTCSAIHHPAGDRGYSGEDRVCNWRPFRAHQKAACGVIAHPIGVKWGRKYSTISTVYKCESRLFFIKPFCWEIFLVCDSRVNQTLAQAHPIDALHLTSCVLPGNN